MKRVAVLLLIFIFHDTLSAQINKDSTIKVGEKLITLGTVVLDNKLNVPSFIERVKNDTSFYKAFKNLRVLRFNAINDIRMNDKKGNLQASLHSKTTQNITNGCRTMQVVEEDVTGDFYTASRDYNYYTAQMYASLFFTRGSICGETNIVKGIEFTTSEKKGMEKHKEQLKMLFFNPGKKINGLPFMSNKTAIYDDEIADSYDMDINWERHNNTNCYVFSQKVKEGKKKNVVIDEMTTWFNDSTFEVVARNYSLSYDAGVYDFKVSMQIEMATVGSLTVPALIRYNGDWKAIFKKRERGIFTATLHGFQYN